jgi:hypothetical protein
MVDPYIPQYRKSARAPYLILPTLAAHDSLSARLRQLRRL